MTGQLIISAAIFIPFMTLVAWLGPAMRRLIRTHAIVLEAEAREADAHAAAGMQDVAVRKEAMAAEVASRVALLALEEAHHQIAREAAGACLEDAVMARRQVLAAQAAAEAEAAPDLLREAARNRGGEMEALAGAYASYCQVRGVNATTFEAWIGNYEGLRS